MQKLTMQDLADMAGVSRITVWKVLNNRPGVSSAVRDRVCKAAIECGIPLRDAPAPEGESKKRVFAVAVARPETSIRQVVIEMTKKPIGAACVVSEDGSLLGILTDGDLRRMLQTVTDIDAQTCGEIMTKKPVCIMPEAHLSEAANLMENRKSKISVLPVVDAENHVIGLLHMTDLVRQGVV